MKIRNGFVSNSSSSSFIITKENSESRNQMEIKNCNIEVGKYYKVSEQFFDGVRNYICRVDNIFEKNSFGNTFNLIGTTKLNEYETKFYLSNKSLDTSDKLISIESIDNYSFDDENNIIGHKDESINFEFGNIKIGNIYNFQYSKNCRRFEREEELYCVIVDYIDFDDEEITVYDFGFLNGPMEIGIMEHKIPFNSITNIEHLPNKTKLYHEFKKNFNSEE